MYEKVNLTETRLRVLALYTNGYDREYYIRETSYLLSVSPRTAQLSLEALEKRGVLSSATKGKIRTFRINRENHAAKLYMRLAEGYKLLTFISKNPEIKELLKEIEEVDPKSILVAFGSYAKGQQRKGSDLDILAVAEGAFDKGKIKALEENHSFRISIKTAKPQTFDKNDFLMREVIENHVCLQNAEEFVRLVW